MRATDNLSGPTPTNQMGPQPEQLSAKPERRPEPPNDKLKTELVSKIKAFEAELLGNYNVLTTKVAQKEK